MKNSKRIASLLLILVFAFTSLFTVTSFAAFSDVDENNQFYEAIQALVDDGTINGYEDGTFKPDNTITRAEFSKILALTSAPDSYVFAAKVTAFPDIPDMNAEHGWAVPYISYAASTKAINGYEDGTFRPGNTVTYAEAVKMIVCTLGYGPVVDTTLDPWYKGYLDIANQIGLTKNAVALGDSPAPRGLVAQLNYNMLTCYSLEQKADGSFGETDKTFDELVNNAKNNEGVLMGITDFSLDGTTVGRGSVLIDKTNYILADNLSVESYRDAIGKRVEFAYSATGDRITKLNVISSYNSELTIEPWQIHQVNDTSIEYYQTEADMNRTKTTTLSFSSPLYVVFNGKPVALNQINASFLKTNLDIETGSLRFVSNDANNKTIEYIEAESYETYYVSAQPGVVNGVLKLVDKHKAQTLNPDIDINEDEVKDSVYKVSSKGGSKTTASLSAITSKSVVSIAQPIGADKEGTIIVISTAKETGEVTELSTDYEEIKINGKDFEYSDYARKIGLAFDQDDNGIFYLDFTGKIVFMEKTAESIPYGLLINYQEGSGMDSQAEFNILPTSGSAQKYTIGATIRIVKSDGSEEEMTAANAINYLKATSANQRLSLDAPASNMLVQPVMYKVNSSKVLTEIHIVPIQDSHYAKGTKSTYNGTVFTEKSSPSKFTVRKGSYVFDIPVDETDISKYKNSSSFEKDGEYVVEPYNVEGGVAEILLRYRTAGDASYITIKSDTPVYMIESINNATYNNEDVYKVSYVELSTGSKNTKYTLRDDDVDRAIAGVASGDLIKFATYEGQIAEIAMVYDASASSDAALTNDTGDVVEAGHYIKRGTNDHYKVVLGTVSQFTDSSSTMILDIYPEFCGSSAPAKSALNFNYNSSTKFYEYKRLGNSSEYTFELIGTPVIYGYDDANVTNKNSATEVLMIMINESVVGVYVLPSNYQN